MKWEHDFYVLGGKEIVIAKAEVGKWKQLPTEYREVMENGRAQSEYYKGL